MSHPQPAEVSAEVVDEWGSHAPETFQEIGRIGQITISLLWVSTVTHLLSTWSDWNTYGVVNRYLGGGPNVDDADLDRADTIARLTSMPNVVISVAAAVIFVIWLWRARVNSEIFCQADHRHSHGWVLASWFCPGPNLWYPKQIVEDVWMASDPKTPAWADNLRPKRPIMITTVWWGCWVGAMIFDVAVRRLLMWVDPTVGVLRGIAFSATVSLLLTGVSAYFAMQLIRMVTAMQTERPWMPWWDQREPSHLTAVPSSAAVEATPVHAPVEDTTRVVPSLRLEQAPELRFAGAGGSEAPRWGSAPATPVNAPAANWSGKQAAHLRAVARTPEPEEEAPTWSPFAPTVEPWSEPEPADALGSTAYTGDAQQSTLGSPFESAANFVPSSAGSETPVPSWNGDLPSSADPLSTPATWQRDETRDSDWQTFSPPALGVLPPLSTEPLASSDPLVGGSYDSSYSADSLGTSSSGDSFSSETASRAAYLAPSAPIPTVAPAEPVRPSRPGRRAAAVAVDSPSSIERESSTDLVQAPVISGPPPVLRPALPDDFLTPSKPLPPVPSFGPEPAYTPEPSYSLGSYESSYSPEPSHPSEPAYSPDSYTAGSYVAESYSPEPSDNPEPTSSYLPPAVDEPAPAPAEPAKPATPRVHPRRRWS